MKLGKQLALVSLVLVTAGPASAQFRSGNVNASLQLLSIPEVRKDLKITEAQSTQLAEVQRGVKTGMLSMIRGLKDVPAPERRKKFESFRSDLDRKVVLILDAGQRKRLHELELQRDGVRTLLKPDVGAELRLTPEQKTKLTTLTRDEMASMRGIYKDSPKTTTPADIEAARGKVQLIQTQTNDAIYNVLTTDQKSKFRVMQGVPFKFPERKTSSISVTGPSVVSPKPAATLKPAAAKPAGKK